MAIYPPTRLKADKIEIVPVNECPKKPFAVIPLFSFFGTAVYIFFISFIKYLWPIFKRQQLRVCGEIIHEANCLFICIGVSMINLLFVHFNVYVSSHKRCELSKESTIYPPFASSTFSLTNVVKLRLAIFKIEFWTLLVLITTVNKSYLAQGTDYFFSGAIYHWELESSFENYLKCYFLRISNT